MTEDKVDTLIGQFGHTYDKLGAADWLFEIIGTDADYYRLQTIGKTETKLIKRGDMVRHYAAGGIALYASLGEMERAVGGNRQ